MIIAVGMKICKQWFTVKVLCGREVRTVKVMRPGQLSPENDRAESVKWAKEVLSSKRTVLMDTETTDVDGYICEMSFINPLGEVIYTTLLDPRVPITPGAFNVHGISDYDVATEPVFGAVWDMLAMPLRSPDWTVVAWNAPYDWGVFNKELERIGEAPLANTWQCAMRRYGAFRGEIDQRHGHYKWHRLQGSHRSLGDCYTMLERIREMANG